MKKNKPNLAIDIRSIIPITFMLNPKPSIVELLNAYEETGIYLYSSIGEDGERTEPPMPLNNFSGVKVIEVNTKEGKKRLDELKTRAALHHNRKKE